MELAKCLITHERTIFLTQDCLDFLRAMDNIDTYAGVVGVDENLYALMCRHRRFKVENEIKVINNLLLLLLLYYSTQSAPKHLNTYW